MRKKYDEAPEGYMFIFRKCTTIKGKRVCKSKGCFKILVKI